MSHEFPTLVSLMARLRGPDGCPWDRKQTHESLKPHLLEETYELLEAIDDGTPNTLKEELGDVLLQILFHSQIASERSEFTFEDVAEQLATKLIRRHPHVFDRKVGEQAIKNSEDVLQRWEAIKDRERQETSKSTSALEGIPKVSPALQRAFQVQKRAAQSGFDWGTISPVLDKLWEELEELFEATSKAATLKPTSDDANAQQGEYQRQVEAELGDVLFSLVNVARFLKVNPEEALRKTTNRFMRRFSYIEQRAEQNGRAIKEYSEAELDQWWEEAKLNEQPVIDSSNTP